MSKFKISLLLLLSLCAFQCNNDVKGIQFDDIPLKELQRTSSLDKKVEAVIVEYLPGRATEPGTDVLIVPPGKKIYATDVEQSIFMADHCSGITLDWKDDQQLQINFNKATIARFSNYWHHEAVDNWNYVVDITLHCTSPNGQLIETDKHPVKE